MVEIIQFYERNKVIFSGVQQSKESSKKRPPMNSDDPQPPSKKTPFVAPKPVQRTVNKSMAVDIVTLLPKSIGQLVAPNSLLFTRLQTVMSELCEVDNGGENFKLFPGCMAQALSITADTSLSSQGQSLGSLTEDYFVTWRSKGIRCLTLVLREGVFLVDKGMNFYQVHLFFPQKNGEKGSQHRTLMDGIVVDDFLDPKDKAKGTVKRILIFDLLAYEAQIMRKRPLTKRLQCLQTNIFAPRAEAQKAAGGMGGYDYSKELIRVRMKDHFPLKKAHSLVSSHFLSSVTHAVDGLVFTPISEMYHVVHAHEETNKGAPILVWSGLQEIGEEKLEADKTVLMTHLEKVATPKS